MTITNFILKLYDLDVQKTLGIITEEEFLKGIEKEKKVYILEKLKLLN